MKTEKLCLKLLFVITACVMTSMASADNYFTIDNRFIPANQLGTDIVVPVKANFSTRVNCWEVQFVLPEGMTLINTTGGNFQFGYDYYGPSVADPHVSFSEDFSHVAAFAYGINRDYDYQAQQWTTRWSAYWSTYLHPDMLLLTIHVDENFTGGDIQVISKGLIGYDPHSPGAFEPITINEEDFGGYVPGDADGNDHVYATDIDYILNYVTGVDTTSLNTIASDVNQDGIIDIVDLEMIWDKYLFEEWFEGYTVWESTSLATFTPSSPVTANNYFYIDSLAISTDDLGKNITVPVKASFDSYVSSWNVQFSFPEGLTPRYIDKGNGMRINYCDWDGDEGTITAEMCSYTDPNTNFTTCVGAQYGYGDYQLNDFGDYESCGSAKWTAGQYEEMLLLTLKVEEWFDGGDIIITSQTSCGFDPRDESTTLYPSTMEHGDEYWPGDINLDGMINISDITCLMYYLPNPDGNSDYINLSGSDVVQDGVIDIMDLVKLIDLLHSDQWYDGYRLTEAENVLSIPGFDFTGDVNGDGKISISDVTALIDLLLLGDEWYYDDYSDVNHDGKISIADVTALIDMLLNN